MNYGKEQRFDGNYIQWAQAQDSKQLTPYVLALCSTAAYFDNHSFMGCYLQPKNPILYHFEYFIFLKAWYLDRFTTQCMQNCFRNNVHTPASAMVRGERQWHPFKVGIFAYIPKLNRSQLEEDYLQKTNTNLITDLKNIFIKYPYKVHYLPKDRIIRRVIERLNAVNIRNTSLEVTFDKLDTIFCELQDFIIQNHTTGIYNEKYNLATIAQCMLYNTFHKKIPAHVYKRIQANYWTKLINCPYVLDRFLPLSNEIQPVSYRHIRIINCQIDALINDKATLPLYFHLKNIREIGKLLLTLPEATLAVQYHPALFNRSNLL